MNECTQGDCSRMAMGGSRRLAFIQVQDCGEHRGTVVEMVDNEELKAEALELLERLEVFK